MDYVLYIDADMLLRLPMDPIAMGVKKGTVVSEHVGYLDVGLKSGIQFQFLPQEAATIAGASATATPAAAIAANAASTTAGAADAATTAA